MKKHFIQTEFFYVCTRQWHTQGFFFSKVLAATCQCGSIRLVVCFLYIHVFSQSGWKWAPQSHIGCHTDHPAAGGDHRRVWEAEDPGHQGLPLRDFCSPQIKCFSHGKDTMSVEAVSDSEMKPDSGYLENLSKTCQHLLILLQLVETILVLSFQSSFSCLVVTWLQWFI